MTKVNEFDFLPFGVFGIMSDTSVRYWDLKRHLLKKTKLGESK